MKIKLLRDKFPNYLSTPCLVWVFVAIFGESGHPEFKTQCT